MSQDIVLTGDRPSGRLHIGHYAGSISSRLLLQERYPLIYILIADLQALTDHAEESAMVRESVMELAIDYLACGLKPERNIFCIQSKIPQISELTMLYMNFVSVARLRRNPTVKNEMKQKGFGDTVPVGFLNYPVSQAADITAFKANIVPVGDDQLPMLEQCNELVRHINQLFETDCLVECQALLSKVTRLPGTDGSNKMSKSLGNCIYLSDDEETVKRKIMSMYTDPNHLRVEDPGKVEGNPVFAYLTAFDPDTEGLDAMKAHYRRGGLGDVKVKKHLIAVLQTILTPIRERRKELEGRKAEILEMLLAGSEKASATAAQTLAELKSAMGLDY